MNNTLTAIIVLVVIVLVGWLAYSQGYFQGADEQQEEDTSGIEIQLGGSNDTGDTQ